MYLPNIPSRTLLIIAHLRLTSRAPATFYPSPRQETRPIAAPTHQEPQTRDSLYPSPYPTPSRIPDKRLTLSQPLPHKPPYPRQETHSIPPPYPQTRDSPTYPSVQKTHPIPAIALNRAGAILALKTKSSKKFSSPKGPGPRMYGLASRSCERDHHSLSPSTLLTTLQVTKLRFSFRKPMRVREGREIDREPAKRLWLRSLLHYIQSSTVV